MFTISREEIDWGGRPLILETGRIARQADGDARAHPLHVGELLHERDGLGARRREEQVAALDAAPPVSVVLF